MEVEFKLFGSLTAKQFGYIIAGGLVGLFFFYVFKGLGSNLLSIIFAGLSGILGISLALIRINDQPFEVWLGNFLNAMFSSQKRVWRKEKKKPKPLTKDKNKQDKIAVPISPPVQRKDVIQAVSIPGVKQTPKADPPKIPKHPFKAYDQVKTSPTLNQDISGRTVSPVSTVLHQKPTPLASRQLHEDNQYIQGNLQKKAGMTSNQVPQVPISVPVTSKEPYGQKDAVEVTGNKKIQGKIQMDMSKTLPSSINTSIPVQTTAKTQHAGQPSQPIPVQQPISGSTQMPSQATMTLQQSQKTQLPTSSQVPSPSSQIPRKAVQFDDIVPSKLNGLKPNGSGTRDTSSHVISPIRETTDLAVETNQLRQKLADYSEDKMKAVEELQNTKQLYSTILMKNELLKKKIQELQQGVNSMDQKAPPELIPQREKKTLPKEKYEEEKEEESKEESSYIKPKQYNGPSLTKKPNVISGIAKSAEGNLLPGVVAIVKNEKNRPVRAMKTNSLGQFVTTTALPNGEYILEFSKEEYSFEKYELSLKGEVLPTYEFIAIK